MVLRSALVVLLSAWCFTSLAQEVSYCYMELQLSTTVEGARFECTDAEAVATAAYLSDASIDSQFECQQSLHHKEELILRARIR